MDEKEGQKTVGEFGERYGKDNVAFIKSVMQDIFSISR